MARKKRSDLAAGLFVLLGVAGLLLTIIWVGAAGLLSRPASRATFYWNTSDGPLWLAKGYKVVEGDMEVGAITGLRFGQDEQGQPRVLYDVEFYPDGYQLRDGAEVKLTSSSLLGLPALAVISRGAPDGEPLDPTVAQKLMPGDMAEIMSNMAAISQALKEQTDASDPNGALYKALALLDHFNAIGSDAEDMIAQVKQELCADQEGTLLSDVMATAENLRGISGQIRTELDPDDPASLLVKIRLVADNLAVASGNVRTYLDEDVATLLGSAQELMDSIQITAGHLQQTTDKVRQLVVVNYDGIDEMMDNMLHVSDNLRAASEEVRRNPWRLLYQPDENELTTADLRESARAFEQGASQLNAAVLKLAAAVNLPADDPARSQELERIQEKLMESFENFQKVEQVFWKELSETQNK